MEEFEISVTWNNTIYHFGVKDYMHHEGEQCKFEIYDQGKFVGSLEPGSHKILHICKNPGLVPEALLDEVADQLERYNL